MKTKIIKQTKNPFLQRDELIIEITSESSPSASELMSELRKDEALTVIKKINTNFGRQTFLAEILIYDNIEARKKIETIPQKIRKKMEAEKKAEIETAKKKTEEEAKAAQEAKEVTKTENEKPTKESNEKAKKEEKAE